eukprot:497489_1
MVDSRPLIAYIDDIHQESNVGIYCIKYANRINDDQFYQWHKLISDIDKYLWSNKNNFYASNYLMIVNSNYSKAVHDIFKESLPNNDISNIISEYLFASKSILCSIMNKDQNDLESIMPNIFVLIVDITSSQWLLVPNHVKYLNHRYMNRSCWSNNDKLWSMEWYPNNIYSKDAPSQHYKQIIKTICCKMCKYFPNTFTLYKYLGMEHYGPRIDYDQLEIDLQKLEEVELMPSFKTHKSRCDEFCICL